MDQIESQLGVMSVEEQAIAQVAIDFLGPYVSESHAFLAKRLQEPNAKSFVARANQNRDLALTLDFAPLLMSATDNYLHLVNVFLHGPALPIFSLFAVVRTAFEADARALWLVAPDIDEKERVGRALTERAENLYELRRMGLPTHATARCRYGSRLKRVIKAGNRWSLEAKTAKYGRVRFVDRPRITTLFRTLLPEESSVNPEMTVGEHTYASLSARAHGTLWTLIHQATSVKRLGDYRQVGVVELDVAELVRLVGVAVGLHDRAICGVAGLAGSDPAVWVTKRGPMPWE